jgi:chaperone LolA
MLSRRIATVALSLLASSAVAGTQSTPPATDLAARIQAHYAKVNDFTADFAQTQSSPLLPKGRTDRGTVKIKKPLRMRWTYADKQEFVSDGLKTYFYEPRDKHVMISSLPKANETSTALLFLAGRGDLTKDFAASAPANQPAGEWRLVLRPVAGRQADFTALTLEVARTSLELRGLVIEDDQAGTLSRLRFTNLRENRGLVDREFSFQIPKGVEPEFR